MDKVFEAISIGVVVYISVSIFEFLLPNYGYVPEVLGIVIGSILGYKITFIGLNFLKEHDLITLDVFLVLLSMFFGGLFGFTSAMYENMQGSIILATLAPLSSGFYTGILWTYCLKSKILLTIISNVYLFSFGYVLFFTSTKPFTALLLIHNGIGILFIIFAGIWIESNSPINSTDEMK